LRSSVSEAVAVLEIGHALVEAHEGEAVRLRASGGARHRVRGPVAARTVAALESLRDPAWEPTPASRDRFTALLPGVVAFRVHVRTEQSMFKLSQDIDAERYERVRDAFAAENPRLADLMDRS
jgi:predicted FMN-binding regulatory protein PaiB